MFIVDDYSRRVWAFMLKHKNDDLNTFIEWKTVIENQTEKKVKKLRTDNGLEYCADVFDEYCKKNGIYRHHSVVGTPQ